MTVRRGGSPRGDRSQARPIRADARQEREATPVRRNGSPGRRPRNGRNGGGPSVLRFALFVGAIVVFMGVLAITVFRPLAVEAVASWAIGNPGTWRLPFVASLVEESLADELATPASSDPSEVTWVVERGDTVTRVGDRLLADGLILSRPAFEFAAWEASLADRLEAGLFRLRRDMDPREVVRALEEDRIFVTTADVTFKEGIRLEQMTAKLQTVDSGVDPQAFYDLVTAPPAEILGDYPWLQLPEGATLEGYLYPSTYRLRTDMDGRTDAEDLVRMMLDEFYEEVGPDRIAVPAERGLSLYEILTLASIVEREAVLDEERPLIAGVYQNRLDTGSLLNADPTVIWGNDTLKLGELPFEQWKEYFFWKPLGVPLAGVEFPPELAGFQTYRVRGLIPGPIASPSVTSIDAALQPDQDDGYVYFVAIPDGGGAHDFSKSLAEHEEKLRKYGYL